MSFCAVYVISIDGRAMISQVYQSKNVIPDSIISAGLLTALYDFTSEWSTLSIEVEKSFQIENLNYHIKKFGDFSVVLVDKSISETERKYIVQNIGWKFLRMFGDQDLLDWKENVDQFNGFYDVITEILDEYFSEVSIPSSITTKKLTTADIFELDQSIQSTALAMLAMEKATIKDVADEINSNMDTAESNLLKLLDLGFLIRENVNGIIHYQSVDQ
ncbi:MAG: hypothetical protein ACXAD7_09245 [Candidatus Kariarchaeaceae archaeon]|jgi:hypothetical protein